MENESGIEYRTAVDDDLIGVAKVYLKAFPESLEELHAPNLRPLAIADLMHASLVAEKDCLFLAMDPRADGGPRIVGYCLAPKDVGGAARAAVRRGLALVWVWRFLTGAYGMGLGSALAVWKDKRSFRGTDRTPEADCPSRILSIAVDPDYQGRGIGNGLLRLAMDRFRRLGMPCVRLEVRPGNVGAKHVYLKSGFKDVGRFEDTRGPWDIMLADLSASEGEGAED